MMRCQVCGEKSPAMFYSSIKTYCKEHWREKVKANRIAKIEHYRQFDRMRASMPHRVAARKEYAATPKGKAAATASKRAWEERNRHKKLATTAVNNAVKRGKLKRQPCFVCGETAEAHHPDYSLPMEVVWLCDTHHKQVHKEHRQYEREAA